MTPDMVRGRRLSAHCIHHELLVARPSALIPARWPLGEGPSTEEWHRTTKHGEANHEQSPAAPFECHDVRRDLWRRPGKEPHQEKRHSRLAATSIDLSQMVGMHELARTRSAARGSSLFRRRQQRLWETIRAIVFDPVGTCFKNIPQLQGFFNPTLAV
jgi:hypothetical protein